MAKTSLQNWEESWKTGHVDPNIFKKGQDFISSESVVVLAGPPIFTNDWESNSTAIGVVEGFNISQSKQVQQLYEIGSRAAYMVPGRTFVTVAMTRVLFNGDSLLKAVTSQVDRFASDEDGNMFDAPSAKFAAGDPSGAIESVDSKFYINLASEFFNRPLGLALVMHDSENDRFGGLYLENCYLQSHQMGIAAQQTVLMENCTVRTTKIQPIMGADNEVRTPEYPVTT